MIRRHQPGGRVWCVLLVCVALVTPITAQVASVSPVAAAPAKRCNGYPCFDRYADLIGWDPTTLDPRMVSTQPIKPRMKVEPPYQTAGLDIDGWAYKPETDGATQGGTEANVYGFNRWQYTDNAYVYVHGLVSVPPVVWTNAAHRNGVKMLGVVTADFGKQTPHHDEGAEAFIELFIPAHKDDTVERLDLLAKTLKFDGWVIDVERPGVAFTPEVIDAIDTLRKRGHTIVTYQEHVLSLDDSTQPVYQAAKTAGAWQSDYPTESDSPRKTYEKLHATGDLDPWQAYSSTRVYDYQDPKDHYPTQGCDPGFLDTGKACLDVDSFMGNLGYVSDGSLPSGRPAWTSIGVYAPAWPIYAGSSKLGDPLPSPDVWRPIDDRLWEGTKQPHGPDCSTVGSGGISQFMTPRSMLGSLPFVSRFNRGTGNTYAIDGVQTASRGWNHFGTEDPLPTWFCSTPGSDPNISVRLDDGAAWEGGTALVLSSKTVAAGAQAEWGLWSADITAPAIDVRFRYSGTGPAPHLKLTFSDGSSQLVSGAAPSANRWTVASASIVPPANAKLTRVTAGVRHTVTMAGASDVRIGEVTLGTAADFASPALITPSAPSSSIISWTTPAATDVRVNVWAHDAAAQCLRFLGPSYATTYDVAHPLFKVPSGSRVDSYRVQPISPAGTTAVLDAPVCSATVVPQSSTTTTTTNPANPNQPGAVPTSASPIAVVPTGAAVPRFAG